MGQLRLNQRVRDHLLRMQGGQTPDQIFEFANIARPAIFLHPVQRRLLDIFLRQSLAGGVFEEMMHEIGNILGAFAQRRQAQRHDIEPEI